MRLLIVLVVCALAAACGGSKQEAAEPAGEQGVLRGRPEIDPNAPVTGKPGPAAPADDQKALAFEKDFEAAVNQACACKDMACVSEVNKKFTAAHKDDDMHNPTQKVKELADQLGKCLEALQPPPGDDGGDDEGGDDGDDGDDEGE
jgi:hypothetical protein